MADGRWLQFFAMQASLVGLLSIGQWVTPSVIGEREGAEVKREGEGKLKSDANFSQRNVGNDMIYHHFCILLATETSPDTSYLMALICSYGYIP